MNRNNKIINFFDRLGWKLKTFRDQLIQLSCSGQGHLTSNPNLSSFSSKSFPLVHSLSVCVKKSLPFFISLFRCWKAAIRFLWSLPSPGWKTLTASTCPQRLLTVTFPQRGGGISIQPHKILPAPYNLQPSALNTDLLFTPINPIYCLNPKWVCQQHQESAFLCGALFHLSLGWAAKEKGIQSISMKCVTHSCTSGYKVLWEQGSAGCLQLKTKNTHNFGLWKCSHADAKCRFSAPLWAGALAGTHLQSPSEVGKLAGVWKLSSLWGKDQERSQMMEIGLKSLEKVCGKII